MAGDESDERALWNAWISPAAAIQIIEHPSIHFETAAKTIGDRIRAGIIDAMAEYAIDPSGINKRLHVALTTKLWAYWAPLENMDFWRTGDIEITRAGVTGYGDSEVIAGLFGVRLNPEQVRAILPKSGTPIQGAPSPPPLKPLPPSEHERTAIAIHAGWPSISEAEAWEKAKIFNPKHKVPREPFLEKYRVIRGHKKRGKQSDSDN